MTFGGLAKQADPQPDPQGVVTPPKHLTSRAAQPLTIREGRLLFIFCLDFCIFLKKGCVCVCVCVFFFLSSIFWRVMIASDRGCGGMLAAFYLHYI